MKTTRSPRIGLFWPLVLLLGSSLSGRVRAQELPVDGSVDPADLARPLVSGEPTPEPVATLEPDEVDGPVYRIEELGLEYASAHPDHPSLEVLHDLELELGDLNGRWVAPRAGLESSRLAPFRNLRGRPCHASALDVIVRACVAGLRREGLVGVFVAPDPRDLDPRTGEDLREGKEGPLRLLVWTARVAEVRTLARGDRIPVEERIDHPAHAFILEHSPLRAGEDGDGDIIRKEELDDYVFWLGRHPGRRVDVALSRHGDGGEVSLDYLVNESRPWLAYLSVSNTGTEQTDEWRQHLGFAHHQLWGRDDILNLDYITAGFDSVHAFLGSYSLPLDRLGRYRFRLGGTWSEFTASDVGIVDEDFSGTGWEARGELQATVFQERQFFLDVFAAARWKRVEVDNEVVDVQGEEDLLLPRLGLRVERLTDLSSLRGELALEWNLADLADTEQFDLDRLGRLSPDVSYQVLEWNLGWSFFLEPLLHPEAWRDVSDPSWSTLAHELVLSFRGQHAFDRRLIPQAQGVVGGLNSVRGYPESVIAGDTVFIANLEYRFHLPRALEVQPDPGQTLLFGKPFRFSPQQHYGRADWDLVLVGFLDAGRALQSLRLPTFEKHASLLGAGVGLEFRYRHHLTLRVDWATALLELERQEVESGDSELHFVGTILY